MNFGSRPCAPRYLRGCLGRRRRAGSARRRRGRRRRRRRCATSPTCRCPAAARSRARPAAGRELHDDEGDQHDAEQRRDHQQRCGGRYRRASGGVSSPGSYRSSGHSKPCRFASAFSSSYHHVAGAPRSYLRLCLGPAEHVPVGEPVRGLVPHRDPVAAGAQHAVERAAGRRQLGARVGGQRRVDHRVDGGIGDAGDVAASRACLAACEPNISAGPRPASARHAAAAA